VHARACLQVGCLGLLIKVIYLPMPNMDLSAMLYLHVLQGKAYALI